MLMHGLCSTVSTVEQLWLKRALLPATMKIEVWQKDMAIIAGLLKEVGASAPLFTATVPIYDAAMALGMEEQDTGGVLAVLERWSSPAARPAARRKKK
jgi:3-hydroxyisobutyrate dehydrogenase-like beta-hydroxyacid dehydrogenase